jgi:uncharacterized protein YceH (UPF0502 family)
VELTPEEQRVLGCLVEKQRTVPDTYPMTLNGLLTACNQQTNRWPVVAYDEATVSSALTTLREKGLTRVVHPSHGARQAKYRHVLDEVLRLDEDEIAVVAVLLLRGAQTVGELRGRTERMHTFDSVDDVERLLDRLAQRDEPLVHVLARQSGQKDPRWVHMLGPVDAGGSEPAPAAAARGGSRVEELAAEVADLRRLVAHLYTVLGEPPPTPEE